MSIHIDDKNGKGEKSKYKGDKLKAHQYFFWVFFTWLVTLIIATEAPSWKVLSTYSEGLGYMIYV